MELHGEAYLVGGVYTASHPKNALLKLSGDLDIKTVRKAEQMLTFLCWDPSGHQKLPLAMAEVPVGNSFVGPNSAQRASLCTLELVGKVLAAAGDTVRGVVFDAATAHGQLRRVIFGVDPSCYNSSLKGIPWFEDLTYKFLPPSVLPRMPCKLAFSQGDPVWALPGACSLDSFCDPTVPSIL